MCVVEGGGFGGGGGGAVQLPWQQIASVRGFGSVRTEGDCEKERREMTGLSSL